ncbi:DUF4424 family protein [Pseudoduganella violaceinigra]|uniref:DUF4424 family protein n=1 Tax=Pseudoduganella violaceinigra TaxID=246602 RepID=UPI0003FEAB12|nr:DUF4424 family protein [Pseudoduganella violaceinigra]
MHNSLRFAIAALVFPSTALANDGVAAVGIGGIVFGKTDAIAMKKEVLTISHDLVSVDYEFLNESANDVEETIVFPLPPYTAAKQMSEAYYGQPDGFSIRVDGKPVAFQSRLVARSPKGKDVTAQLRKLGLSNKEIAYTPSFARKSGKVAAFTEQQARQMIELGLLDKDSWDPSWEVEVNYVWTQKFPPNRIVRVHHDYQPFVAAGPGESAMNEEFEKKYCADQAYVDAYWRIVERKEGGFDVANVAYILTTGNTWKRGIEDFTLNIVKRKPDELVSLCFPGKAQKVDALTYRFHLSNFHPSKDLDVAFGNVADNESADGVMPRLPQETLSTTTTAHP